MQKSRKGLPQTPNYSPSPVLPERRDRCGLISGAVMQPALYPQRKADCCQPSHGFKRSWLQLQFSWLLLEIPIWILSSWPGLAAFLYVVSPTCVTQPLLQQRFELAHILKAQIESLEAGNGGLAEIIAIELPHGESNITLPEQNQTTT